MMDNFVVAEPDQPKRSSSTFSVAADQYQWQPQPSPVGPIVPDPRLPGVTWYEDYAGEIYPGYGTYYDVIAVNIDGLLEIIDNLDQILKVAASDYLPRDGSEPMLGSLILARDPTELLEAATKRYVDNAVGGEAADFLSLDGGQMRGPILLAPPFTQPNEAVSKAYVDAATPDLSGYLPLAGGRMTGNLTIDTTQTAFGGYGNNLVLRTSGNEPGMYLVTANRTWNIVAGGAVMLLGWNDASTISYVMQIGTNGLQFNVPLTMAASSIIMTGNNPITMGSSYTPTLPAQVANKGYVDGFLPLTGGQMQGPLLLLPPFDLDNEAIDKQYVDDAIGSLMLYEGTWQVAANIPDLSGGGTRNSENYMAVTANPNVPEYAPGNIPGIAGQLVHNGDRIIWAADLQQWQLVREGNLTLQIGDARYLQLTGGIMQGPIVLQADPAGPMEPATRQYVDARTVSPAVVPPLMDSGGLGEVGTSLLYARQDHVHPSDTSRLALTGGTLSGPLQVPYGSTTAPSLRFAANTGIWGGAAQVRVSVSGFDAMAWTRFQTIGFVPLNMTNNVITDVADPIDTQDAATKAYVDVTAGAAFPEAPTDGAIYGRGGATPGWSPVLPLAGGVNNTMTGTVYAPSFYVRQGGVNVATWASSQIRLGIATSTASWLSIGGTAASNKAIYWEVEPTGLQRRWTQRVYQAETGGLSGSIMSLDFYNDAGGGIANMYTGYRDGRGMVFSQPVAMTRPLTLIPPYTQPDQAVSKDYVDTLLGSLQVFKGTWKVALNEPPLTGETSPGYYIAVTADPQVPETAPASVPGIGGSLIYNSDNIYWDGVLGVYEQVRGGGLTKAEADTFYVELAGDEMSGPLVLAGDAVAPLEAVPLQQLGDYLLISGGQMTGPLVLAADATAALEAVTLQQLTSTVGQYLPLGGGTLSGGLGFGNDLVSSPDDVSRHIALLSSGWCGFSVSGDSLNIVTNYAQSVALDGAGNMRLVRGDLIVAGTATVAVPTADAHAATKAYVDGLVGTGDFLPLTGGTLSGGIGFSTLNTGSPEDLSKGISLDPTGQFGFSYAANAICYVASAGSTGHLFRVGGISQFLIGPTVVQSALPLTLPGSPTQALHAATKGYVDSLGLDYLKLAGGQMQGALLLLPPYTQVNQAVSKEYVDTAVSATTHFMGLWQVANNSPDISNPGNVPGFGAITDGDFFVAQTAVPTTPERPPAGIPGLNPVAYINNSDYIYWNAQENIWQTLRGSALTLQEAEQIFMPFTGGAFSGVIQVSGGGISYTGPGGIIGSSYIAFKWGYPNAGRVALWIDNSFNYGDLATTNDLGNYYTQAQADARYLQLTGGALSGGINFGAATVINADDLSRHIALYGTSFGFSVTSNTVNYVVPPGSSHHFRVGGVPRAAISDVAATFVVPTYVPQPPMVDNSTLVATTGFVTSAFGTRVNDMSPSRTLSPSDVFGEILVFFGNPGSPTTLTFPAANLPRSSWFIWHNGGAPITLAGTGGGTVTFQPGTSGAVWCDGQGIYELAGGLSQNDADARYLQLSGGTLTGQLVASRGINISGGYVLQWGTSNWMEGPDVSGNWTLHLLGSGDMLKMTGGNMALAGSFAGDYGTFRTGIASFGYLTFQSGAASQIAWLPSSWIEGIDAAADRVWADTNGTMMRLNQFGLLSLQGVWLGRSPLNPSGGSNIQWNPTGGFSLQLNSTLGGALDGSIQLMQSDGQGEAYKPTAGPWGTIGSDARIKKGIRPYERGLEEICMLEPVSYSFNGLGGMKDDGKIRYSFTAQNLQAAMPECVFEVPQDVVKDAIPGQLGMDIGPVTLALVNSIKTLNARVAALEAVQPMGHA